MTIKYDDGDGNGADSITNYANKGQISAGHGENRIENYGDSVRIFGGKDNVSVNNSGSKVAVTLSSGDDTISNSNGDSVTIDGGDGKDTISGFGSSSTLQITSDTLPTFYLKGSDVIFTLGKGSVTLVNAAQNDELNIIDAKGKKIDLKFS